MRIRFTLLACLLASLSALQSCRSSTPNQETSASATERSDQAASTPELIQRGRRFLDLRQAEEAEPLFQQALDRDPEAFEPRLWLLRSWMDQGRSNDTLDAIDQLRRAGHSGAQMDYLYGMAFLRRAQNLLSAGVTDSSPRMNFEDAVFRLGKALETYPEEYPDAYQGVAIGAWFSQDLERARWAGEHAVELSPDSARAWLQLGRIAMSQFSAARSAREGMEWDESTRTFHGRALQAFGQAIEALGQPLDDAQEQRLLSDAGMQLGHAHVWNGQRNAALDAYALGMAWAPESVNFGQIQSLLAPVEGDAPRPGLFHRALESANAQFQLNFGAEDTRAASMLWWLGWERLAAGHAVGAEIAFLNSVHQNPEFINAWFYVAQARFAAGNFAGGADALAQGWQFDSNIMVDSVLADKETNLWSLGQALDQLIGQKKFASAETNQRAATLARLMAEANPYDGWNWNNLGMFVRDQADALVYGGRLKAEAPAIQELYEKSYSAYQRSIKLLPEDAGVVNDTAVLLQYYLKRDLDQARSMYEHSTELAEAALKNEELDAWERKRLETALRDSLENHRLLMETLAQNAESELEEPSSQL